MKVTWNRLLQRAELAGLYVWRLGDGYEVRNGEEWAEQFSSIREAYAFCTGVVRGQQRCR